jgi:hypothetical protein
MGPRIQRSFRVTMTRLLMSASALTLLLLGTPCVFGPEIVLARLGAIGTGAELLVVQVTGALYCGFAVINWMGRGSLIGGIYGRPVAMGNVLHFTAAGLAIAKAAHAGLVPASMWVVAAIYAIFLAGFAYVVFGNPLPKPASP